MVTFDQGKNLIKMIYICPLDNQQRKTNVQYKLKPFSSQPGLTTQKPEVAFDEKHKMCNENNNAVKIQQKICNFKNFGNYGF